MVATVIICVVIVAIAVFAVRQAARAFSGDGSCCGQKSKKHVRRVKVADTNEANYPFVSDLAIGGMTCEKCVSTVENTLNAFDDVWARVDLEKKSAHVLSKQALDTQAMDDALREAGYFLTR
jgi:copper chaperone CopZ